MSTASFEKDGSVVLGRPANHRALGLFYADGLPLEALLAGNYDKLTNEQFESIYGRGWLLTHYLYFDEKRKGQLTAYVQAISAGTPALDAARKAFVAFRGTTPTRASRTAFARVIQVASPSSSPRVA